MWLFGFYHLWMLFLFNHGHFNISSNPFPSLKTNLWMNIKYIIQEMYVYFTDIRWAVLIEMKSGYPIGVSFRPLLHSYGRIPALSESGNDFFVWSLNYIQFDYSDIYIHWGIALWINLNRYARTCRLQTKSKPDWFSKIFLL